MGIAVTKNGNMYNKTHAGTVVGGAAGAVAGVSVATANAEKIETGCRELLGELSKEFKEMAKERRSEFFGDAFDKGGRILFDGERNVPRPRATATTEINYRIGEKIINAVDYFRIHSTKCLGIAGGVVGAIAIGSIINGVINKCKAHSADKQHPVKTAVMENINEKK